MHSLNQRPPKTIIVPTAALEPPTKVGPHAPPSLKPESTILVKALREAYEDATMVSVKRNLWNEGDGADYVKKLAIEDDKKQAVLHAVENKFVAPCTSSLEGRFKP